MIATRALFSHIVDLLGQWLIHPRFTQPFFVFWEDASLRAFLLILQRADERESVRIFSAFMASVHSAFASGFHTSVSLPYEKERGHHLCGEFIASLHHFSAVVHDAGRSRALTNVHNTMHMRAFMITIHIGR